VAIGHGLGGWASMVAASHDPRIHAIATLGGISNLRTMSLSDEAATDYVRFLRNISGRGIQSQWRALGATYNPVDLMDLLQACPLLIVHGTADEVVPVSQARELEAKARAAEVVLMEGADHAFSQHRMQLVETVVPWVLRQS
jgi:dipeptidyl aminopeptidase/acylaminoacyl peptidase